MPKTTKIKPFSPAEWLDCYWAGVIRFQLEYVIIQKGFRPKEFDRFDVSKNIRRPVGWRLRIWKKLLKTVFKDIHSFKPEGDVRSAAFIMGAYRQAMAMLDSMEEQFEELDELAKEIGCSGFTLDEEIVEKAEKQIDYWERLFDFGKFQEYVQKEKPSEMEKLFLGYGEGYGVIGSVDETGEIRLKKPTDATNVYMLLLLMGDLLRRQPSVKAVHMVFESILGPKYHKHSYESFRLLCNRVGFTCVSYARTKRRNDTHARER
ncbi:hypothetical protein [Cerasicoccus fimbriatus]|uniref:hypothetical protein n=1 Tax=Cerasicoccus fimbriatus TaxID=3014554 RepID=UPI0022B46D80|nr:hypothetical protein [Cerasicoccus sp. TK19100]